MTVLIDGATLSRLLFYYLNNVGNQYGFLLGEKVDQVEDRISDSQIHTSDVNSLLCISSFLPWPSNEPMYSRSGCLNDECLEQLLTNTEQSVVGWYSFRHQSVLRPSLREMTLHDHLATGAKSDLRAEDFFFFLCTSSSSSNMSTFSCNHVFLQLKDGCFKEMPLTILNLGDTTRKEYRKQSNATLSHCRSVNEILQKARGRFVHSSGEMDQVVRVNFLASSLSTGLETIQSKLTQSEGILGLLEAEVDSLRSRLKHLEQEQTREQLASDAERRLKEEQRERIEEDQAAEAEEKAEMEKLLKDLGLTQQQDQFVPLAHASEATSSAETEVSASSIKTRTVQSEKYQLSPETVNGGGFLAQDSAESSSSDCEDFLSKINVKKVNGQKTYSRNESAKQTKEADPFDFLASENEKQKEKLLKANEQSAKSVTKPNLLIGKTNTLKFAGLSNSPEINGPNANSRSGDMLSEKAHGLISSDDDASVSSNGLLEDNPASPEQDHLNNISDSPLYNETYIVSSSPSF